eukprot:1626289-Pleurochrysis_carterae.AAC.15
MYSAPASRAALRIVAVLRTNSFASASSRKCPGGTSRRPNGNSRVRTTGGSPSGDSRVRAEVAEHREGYKAATQRQQHTHPLRSAATVVCKRSRQKGCLHDGGRSCPSQNHAA